MGWFGFAPRGSSGAFCQFAQPYASPWRPKLPRFSVMFTGAKPTNGMSWRLFLFGYFILWGRLQDTPQKLREAGRNCLKLAKADLTKCFKELRLFVCIPAPKRGGDPWNSIDDAVQDMEGMCFAGIQA